MGWEMRGDNGPYYYSTRKVKGRTVRQYWGIGDAGTLGRYCDILERHSLSLERADLFMAKETWDKADAAVKTVCGSCWARVQALLHAAGYHRPNRGPWRKKRMRKAIKTISKKAQPLSPSLSPQEIAALYPEDAQERADLILAAANAETLSSHEEAVALACLRASRGDLAVDGVGKREGVKNVLILTTRNAVHRELLLIELNEKARDLAGPNPSPLEVLLVDRVLASYLLVNFYELQCASLLRARHEGMGEGQSWANPNRPDRQGETLHKRLDDAHHRFLSASKTLAQVRRLQVPVNVQVNVAANGGQQVNVSGSLSA